MKRHLLCIMLFLLLGMAVNVGVAWACAAWSAPTGERFIWARHSEGLGYRVRTFETLIKNLPADNSRRPGDAYRSIAPVLPERLECGLPMLALTRPLTLYETAGNPKGSPPHVPLRPIWPGFSVNTLFYAALLWIPIAARSRLRRMLRLRRGCCARCGYPIGKSAVCTECGTGLRGFRGA
jgi:hypothetical protein